MMGESCACFYDGEYAPEFFNERIVTARKAHRCGECGEEIKPGQRYEYVRGCWEGDFSTHKTCLPCRNVRDSLMKCGFIYGRVWEDVREWLDMQGIDPYDDDGQSWLR